MTSLKSDPFIRALAAITVLTATVVVPAWLASLTGVVSFGGGCLAVAASHLMVAILAHVSK